jgi:DNA-binding IclR family transcriptional regulator
MAQTVGVDSKPRYSVRVLERAIRLLSVLSDGDAASLTELARRARLNDSTTVRLLSTLEHHRFVRRDLGTGQYRLGPACLELAHAYLDGTNIIQQAMPVLEELRDYTRETVHLAILDRMEVYYLVKIPGYHAIGLMASRVGHTAPAHCTGLGKAMLAFLPEGEVRAYYQGRGLERLTDTTITDLDALLAQLEAVRESDYALDFGERHPDVFCVAAPVRATDGKVVAAISVSGPEFRMKPNIEKGDLIQVVREAARSISGQIAGWRPHAMPALGSLAGATLG